MGGARAYRGAGSAVETPVSAKCSIATRSRLSMAVCGYVLLVVCTSCPTAVNQDHIAWDLICTGWVSQGGQHSRATGRRCQGATRNVRLAHARASVSTLLLYALGLVVLCRPARLMQKAKLSFSQLVGQRRDVSPRTFVFFRGNVIEQLFWWHIQSFFPSRIGWFPRGIWLFPRSPPWDIVIFLFF